MSTVANIMPCPCCDRGGFDHEPCPSRVDLDKYAVETRRLRALVEGYRDELSNAAKALGFDLDRPSGGRVFLAEEVAKLRARVTALESSLEYTLRIIDYELPPLPDPRGDDGEACSQHYRFEGIMTARALLPKREDPDVTFAAMLPNGIAEDK